jgi:hypothetical protein
VQSAFTLIEVSPGPSTLGVLDMLYFILQGLQSIVESKHIGTVKANLMAEFWSKRLKMRISLHGQLLYIP